MFSRNYLECSSNRRFGITTGEIPDNWITASSHAPGYPAYKARARGPSCWRSAENIPGEFLEINFGKKRYVSEIEIQGDPHADNWTEQFYLAFSVGSVWRNVTRPHQGVKVSSLNYFQVVRLVVGLHYERDV